MSKHLPISESGAGADVSGLIVDPPAVGGVRELGPLWSFDRGPAYAVTTKMTPRIAMMSTEGRRIWRERGRASGCRGVMRSATTGTAEDAASAAS
jgi:hypothetical protein